MKKITSFLLALFVLVIPIIVYGQEEDIPSHTQDFYVNDYANVLDSQAKEYIMKQSIRLYELSGAQVVVVTIDSIGDIPLEEYSLSILRGWGIGSKDKNNGVLILIAVEDRKSRIEVGYGLEGALPDSKTGWIQDDYMIPYFSEGDYSTGILEGYKAIVAEIYNEYNLETDSLEELSPVPTPHEYTEESQESSDGKFFVIFIIVFLLFDRLFLGGRILRLLLIMLFSGRRGGPRGGGNWGGGGWSGGGGYSGGGGSGGGGGSSRSW
ncbi:MAG: TPM domain-containing protein [Caldicoprobacterales bacterium]|jgi:uncharacterized protein|nr:TPM domain-containing protein [Clostridiales bacterium]